MTRALLVLTALFLSTAVAWPEWGSAPDAETIALKRGTGDDGLLALKRGTGDDGLLALKRGTGDDPVA